MLLITIISKESFTLALIPIIKAKALASITNKIDAHFCFDFQHDKFARGPQFTDKFSLSCTLSDPPGALFEVF